ESTRVLLRKVPRTREPHLFVMSIGSICWAVAAVSVAIPLVGTFLLSFLPLPEQLDSLIVWYFMLLLLIAIPPLITVAVLRALNADDRPEGYAAQLGIFLKGYPFALS